MSRTRLPVALLLALFLPCRPAPAAGAIDFQRDVLPILSENCFACHGPDARARKAKLRLDTREGASRKSDPVIVPGKSADSELIRRIRSSEPSEIMPPPRSKKKLTAGQIAVLQQWIDQGAPWSKHWAFVNPRRPAVPGLSTSAKRQVGSDWGRNPIDAFLLAAMHKHRLHPSPQAIRERLLRRVTLDLTGLPPSIAEMDAFLKDTSPGAYERLVDRLLASPRFGERMVWEWLDAARYADSNGYQGDADRTMWPWRDWAVAAFNANMPFDQFTVWQLAGDLMPTQGADAPRSPSTQQRLATAFLRNHMINGEGGRIAEENRIDYVMDMTETTGTVWLGLTLNCCRCHDHKYDPLLQKEYYSLFAFFNQTPVTGGGGDPQTRPVVELFDPQDQDRLAAVRKKTDAAAREIADLETTLFPRDKSKPADESPAAKDLPKALREALRPAPVKRNRAQLSQIEKHFASSQASYAGKLNALNALLGNRDDLNRRVPRVMVMEDMPKPRDTFVLTRGLYSKPGEKVQPGVPAVLPPLPGGPRNRLTLARWIVSPDNPLTARVVVNRYWQQFFGAGLVKTIEDFGTQGERPINQDLLDWLAVDFRDNGWDLKQLCKQIVTSAAYMQSSRVTPESAERDPENRLLARGPRLRLPSWMIRDQALAAGGLLVGTLGGPGVNGYQPSGIWEEATFGTKRYRQDHGRALYRRSVYTFWRRIIGPTMFFDVASRQTCTVKQGRTNTPLHALATLNGTTYVEAARALAERVLTTAEAGDEKRIELAFRLVLARFPTSEERNILLAGLKRLRGQYAADPIAAKKLLAVGESKRNDRLNVTEHAALTALCHAILNLDEAVTKE
jgi:hypothetical protein